MTATKLEVVLCPAELAAMRERDLSGTVCVVFDVLRATTSMVSALANGAEAIIPVGEISEALAIRQQRPEVLLAGEREGLRIRGNLTGGLDFDLGNSPREFTADKVQGRTIVMTTTNGTRALRACDGARAVLVSCFLNLRATYLWLLEERPTNLILVCSGTFEEPALEDVLAIGAVCERIWPLFGGGHVSDSAEIARRIYPLMQYDLLGAMKHSRNGRRLLANPELRSDVWFSVQRETVAFVAEMCADGAVRKSQ
jgi:2-phosphosulfolactate phosphatase